MTIFAVKMKRLATVIFLILSCIGLRAQFSLTGTDPQSVRWMQVETPDFRIIYPAGEDSLARVYGSWLEKARVSVSWSSGLEIGQAYKTRMPVILHSFNALPNASVVWAPKRMDIYTVLDPYAPTPIRWERHLAIHEGRHAAQMQAGAMGRNKPMHYLLGEMFAGALAGIYPGPTILEGDAVVAETALTASGRGRQASFLEYMMPAFDCGDWRDYWQWSLGSRKFYAPDYYRTGYMLVSGMRVFFDDPLFIQEYFKREYGKGLFFNLQKTIRPTSGMGLKNTFRAIEGEYQALWAEEAARRGPFMPSSQVSRKPWRHTVYSGSVAAGDSGIWTLKAGLTAPRTLVKMTPDGKERRIRPFASYTGYLSYDGAGNRIWWSETVSHWRWSLGSSSRIRYIDLDSPSRVHDLTKQGKYFNPVPSPDGSLVAVTEYPSSGGSRICILNSSDGSVERVIQAPDSLQFTESAWAGDHLVVAGLSDHGMGVYIIDRSRPAMTVMLSPQPVELSCLRAISPVPEPVEGPAVSFLCDRTGVRELYILEIDTGRLLQATSTRYGISSPFFSPSADTLYYSALAPSDRPEAYKQGKMIYATATSDLPLKEVRFSDIHHYPVADALTRQEMALAGDAWDEFTEYSETTFSEPRRFSKVLPRVHSWAPVYFNYDNIDDFSSDSYYKTGSAGATVMFQNLAGTGYGFVGYGFHKDQDEDSAWRHSGHFKYLNTGLVPVLELSADVGDRAAMDFGRVQVTDRIKNKESVYTSGTTTSRLYTEACLRAYVPVNLSSGGISRGIVPQVKYRLTNDRFEDRISIREIRKEGGKDVSRETGSLNQEHLSSLSSLDLSLRGYVMRDMAPSRVYPSIGIGAEAGLRTRPGHSDSYADMAYLYAYGYLPGILQDQGLRVSASVGLKLGGGPYSYPDTPVSFLPRGFVDTNIRSITNSCSPTRFKLTFDYAIPFLNVDWSALSPVAYIKNFQLTPFLDYSYHEFDSLPDLHVNRTGVRSEIMTSLGADLTVNLGNLAWLPYDTQVGVRYAYNSWDLIELFPAKGLDHHYFGLVFDISM